MAKLFGVDIAKIVHKEISKGLLPGTLTAIRKGDRKADVTAGREQVETSHAFRGIIEHYKENAFEGTHVQRGEKKVLMTSGSINPFIAPEKGDKVVIDGETLKVTEIEERDPASATYVLQVRGTR